MPVEYKVYVKTGSGQLLEAARPEDYTFDPEEIAMGLRSVRFNNQHRNALTVLQHSFLVAELIRMKGWNWLPEYKAALLHDASEAFLADLNPAVKTLLPGYKRLEQRYTNAINAQFDAVLAANITKHFDYEALMLEMSMMPSMRSQVGDYRCGSAGLDKLQEIRDQPESSLIAAFIDVLTAKPSDSRWLV